MPGNEEKPWPQGKVTHVRTSLVLSSVQALRKRGHFERYAALLSEENRSAILDGVAGGWFTLDMAMAHYRACDELALGLNEQVSLGAEVGDRIQGSFLGLLLRAAKGMGVTPWTPLSNIDRIWNRVFKGGGGAVVEKLGPKEATCQFVGLPIVDVAYLRNAWRGAFHAGMQPFCDQVHVQEVAKMREVGSALYRLTWV